MNKGITPKRNRRQNFSLLSHQFLLLNKSCPHFSLHNQSCELLSSLKTNPFHSINGSSNFIIIIIIELATPNKLGFFSLIIYLVYLFVRRWRWRCGLESQFWLCFSWQSSPPSFFTLINSLLFVCLSLFLFEFG